MTTENKSQAWDELVDAAAVKAHDIIPDKLAVKWEFVEARKEGANFAVENIHLHPKVANLLEKLEKVNDIHFMMDLVDGAHKREDLVIRVMELTNLVNSALKEFKGEGT